MQDKFGFVARLWYYFRIGYATYLTFVLGVANTLIVVWYLAIREIPAVENFFGHFIPFAIAVTLVGTPLSVLIGWAHIKRSPAWTSELDIGVEANPWNFKLPPGWWQQAFAPTYLEILLELKRLLSAQGLLSEEDKTRVEGLENKLKRLIDGGSIGTPRRKP
jgi:hypothetical protein